MTLADPDQLRRERQIAFEFVFLAAGEHLTPREVLAAIGHPWNAPWAPTWHDVVLALIAERRRALCRTYAGRTEFPPAPSSELRRVA